MRPTTEQVMKALRERDRVTEQSITELFYKMRQEGGEVHLTADVVSAAKDTSHGHVLESVVVMGEVGNQHDKEVFAEAVRRICKERNAIWVSVFAEAWTYTLPKGQEATIRPVDHPQRREVLYLTVQGVLGQRQVSWPILGEGKTATLGEPTTYEGRIEGRFADLIDSPTTH